jgi:hypothetical protein
VDRRQRCRVHVGGSGTALRKNVIFTLGFCMLNFSIVGCPRDPLNSINGTPQFFKIDF